MSDKDEFDWRRYKKAFVASAGGMVIAGLAALDATGVLHSWPWADASVAAVTAMSVYQVRNKPEAPVDPLDPSLQTPRTQRKGATRG